MKDVIANMRRTLADGERRAYQVSRRGKALRVAGVVFGVILYVTAIVTGVWAA